MRAILIDPRTKPMTLLDWKPDTIDEADAIDPETCTNWRADHGAITYYVWPVLGGFGFGTRLIVRGPRGGKRQMNLGHFKMLAKAKEACERHVAAGCDVSEATRLGLSDTCR